MIILTTKMHRHHAIFILNLHQAYQVLSLFKGLKGTCPDIKTLIVETECLGVYILLVVLKLKCKT